MYLLLCFVYNVNLIAHLFSCQSLLGRDDLCLYQAIVHLVGDDSPSHRATPSHLPPVIHLNKWDCQIKNHPASLGYHHDHGNLHIF